MPSLENSRGHSFSFAAQVVGLLGVALQKSVARMARNADAGDDLYASGLAIVA